MNLDSVRDCGPDFLCVGAQKAGTSWLYKQLSGHPDFWMPPWKELHYLNQPGHAPFIPALRNRDKRDPLFFENLTEAASESWARFGGVWTTFRRQGVANFRRHHTGLLHAAGSSHRAGYALFSKAQSDLFWRAIQSSEHGRNCPWMFVLASSRPSMSLILRRSCVTSCVLRSCSVPILAESSPGGGCMFRWISSRSDSLTTSRMIRSNSVMQSSHFLEVIQKSSSRLQPKLSGAASRKKLPLSGETRAQLAKFFAAELEACATELGRLATFGR